MNTKNTPAKREEEFQLLQFLDIENIVKFEDNPDLILNINGQRIGIEHTRVFRDRGKSGSPERHRESMEDQILDDAKSLYAAEKHYDFSVRATFNDIVPIAQKQIPRLAQQLCNCIGELESTVISGCSGPFDWNTNQSLQNKIPNAISVLWIDKASYGNDHWLVSDGGAVGSLKSDFIQLALDAKKQKILKYKSKCDEVWVVTAASGSRMSSYFDRDNPEFLECAYDSSADKLYLLDCVSNKVHELQIKEK